MLWTSTHALPPRADCLANANRHVNRTPHKPKAFGRGQAERKSKPSRRSIDRSSLFLHPPFLSGEEEGDLLALHILWWAPLEALFFLQKPFHPSAALGPGGSYTNGQWLHCGRGVTGWPRVSCVEPSSIRKRQTPAAILPPSRGARLSRSSTARRVRGHWRAVLRPPLGRAGAASGQASMLWGDGPVGNAAGVAWSGCGAVDDGGETPVGDPESLQGRASSQRRASSSSGGFGRGGCEGIVG